MSKQTHCQYEQCKKPITEDRQRFNARYCNGVCTRRAAAERRRRQEPDGYHPIHRMKRAAVSELLTATDLLENGFEVFRSMSWTATCDLVALLDGHPYRVEVKTAQKTLAGNISCSTSDKSRADFMALVLEGKVYYRALGECQLPAVLIRELPPLCIDAKK